MLKLLLEIGKGALASVIVLAIFRAASWAAGHIEHAIPTETTFSYSILKLALDYVGVIGAIIIMVIYTAKGIIELFRKPEDTEEAES